MDACPSAKFELISLAWFAKDIYTVRAFSMANDPGASLSLRFPHNDAFSARDHG